MAFIPYNQNQQQLLPTDINEMIPEDHLVRAVNDVVEKHDISSIKGKYKDGGRDAYHPKVLLKVLFYGYANGERSSRVLEDRVMRDVFYMWLTAMQRPNFSTIAHFRQTHLKEIKELFVQVVMICKEMGRIRVGHWSIDGTKVKANASRYKSNSSERLEEELKGLREEVGKALNEAQEKDREEDKEYGEKESGTRMPKELKKKEERVRRIEAAVKRLEESKTSGKANTTDPEAVFMKRTGGGYDVAYNAQITVDDANQVIVGSGVSSHPADNTQLVKQVDKAVANVGEKPSEVSADSGYEGGLNLKAMEDRGIDAYIPQGENPWKEEGEDVSESKKYAAAKFIYDEQKDVYICPEAKELRFETEKTVKGATGSYTHRVYRGMNCMECCESTRCTKNPCNGRMIVRSELQPLIVKMKQKLATQEGRKRYGRRKCIVEPVFGVVKYVMKFTQFHLRGLEKVQAEWELVCLAFNIRKIWTKRYLAKAAT